MSSECTRRAACVCHGMGGSATAVSAPQHGSQEPPPPGPGPPTWCVRWSPWDMFRRTTDMPASARRKSESRSHEVGPAGRDWYQRGGGGQGARRGLGPCEMQHSRPAGHPRCSPPRAAAPPTHQSCTLLWSCERAGCRRRPQTPRPPAPAPAPAGQRWAAPARRCRCRAPAPPATRPPTLPARAAARRAADAGATCSSRRQANALLRVGARLCRRFRRRCRCRDRLTWAGLGPLLQSPSGFLSQLDTLHGAAQLPWRRRRQLGRWQVRA